MASTSTSNAVPVPIRRTSPISMGKRKEMNRSPTIYEEEGGEWVLDARSLSRGKEVWTVKERVILVLGDVDYNSLKPLTNSPLLSNTLILLSSTGSYSTIDSYPTLQNIQLPSPSNGDLSVILDKAIAQATKWRKSKKSKGRNQTNNNVKVKNPQPIDCIINFLPSSLKYDPSQALSKLIRDAVISTTGITARLSQLPLTQISGTTSTSSSSSLGALGSTYEGGISGEELPITLLHVLPVNPPIGLSLAIEKYLLSLLPSLQNISIRGIKPWIISSSAWTSKIKFNNENNEPTTCSSPEMIILSGLQCSSSNRPNVGNPITKIYLDDLSTIVLPTSITRPLSVRSTGSSGSLGSSPRSSLSGSLENGYSEDEFQPFGMTTSTNQKHKPQQQQSSYLSHGELQTPIYMSRRSSATSTSSTVPSTGLLTPTGSSDMLKSYPNQPQLQSNHSNGNSNLALAHPPKIVNRSRLSTVETFSEMSMRSEEDDMSALGKGFREKGGDQVPEKMNRMRSWFKVK